jgi:hypothetical protein
VCRHPRAAPSAHAPACCLSLNPTEAASRSQAARGRPIRTGWVHGTIGRRCPWRRVATRRAPVGRGGQLAFVSLSRAWPPAQGSPRFRAHMMMVPRRASPSRSFSVSLQIGRAGAGFLHSLPLSAPALERVTAPRAHSHRESAPCFAEIPRYLFWSRPSARTRFTPCRGAATAY